MPRGADILGYNYSCHKAQSLKMLVGFFCVELIIGLRPHDTFEFFEFFSRTVNGVFGCWPHLFSIE